MNDCTYSKEAYMLLSTISIRQHSLVITVIWIAILFTSCSQVTSEPITLIALTPSPTLAIPSSTSSASPSPAIVPTSTPDFCNSSLWQEKIQVISPKLFTALGPGGPSVFDRILVEQNPAWAEFRQYDHDEMRSAGVIFHETAFGPELGTGVNPAILLATYGTDKNWELPANGDLVAEVDYIRAVLHQRENYWILGVVDRSQYPMVKDGANYALYYYFGGDFFKLEDWCRTYVRVFHESPLKESDT